MSQSCARRLLGEWCDGYIEIQELGQECVSKSLINCIAHPRSNPQAVAMTVRLAYRVEKGAVGWATLAHIPSFISKKKRLSPLLSPLYGNTLTRVPSPGNERDERRYNISDSLVMNRPSFIENKRRVACSAFGFLYLLSYCSPPLCPSHNHHATTSKIQLPLRTQSIVYDANLAQLAVILPQGNASKIGFISVPPAMAAPSPAPIPAASPDVAPSSFQCLQAPQSHRGRTPSRRIFLRWTAIPIV